MNGQGEKAGKSCLAESDPSVMLVQLPFALGAEAHGLPAAFHSQCQSTDSQHFGLQGSGLIFFFFSKDAELAPRSNDDDSWGTNPHEEASVFILLIQSVTAGELSFCITLRCSRAE